MLAQHSDPTVRQVLKTGAPRMIVQGIDYKGLMTSDARIARKELRGGYAEFLVAAAARRSQFKFSGRPPCV